ncbi:MAG: glutathione S-transferase N-terminal domain-containing protein [Pseudomonadota bacterium]
MIDLHYWPTPNGWKISIMLEECGLPYKLVPVNIGKGEQFAPDFLAISPNNRMPAIVDHAPAGGGDPIAVFESGAILQYLAEKTGRFLPLPTALRERYQVLQWLNWQMGGLGPMAGQNGHFLLYAPEKIPYAIERYGKEVDRLYGVLDAQLARTGAFVAGADYSIADMAIFPWTRTHKAQNVQLERFPHVQRWYNALFERPAAKRGLDLGKELRAPALTEEARKALFGQTADSVRAGEHKKPDFKKRDTND